MARRMIAVAMLVAATIVAGIGESAAAAEGATRYYLSLGDSLAFGFQSAKAHPGLSASEFDSGYSDVLARRLQHGRSGPTLVNYGCPGESTTSYSLGGCPWTMAGLPLHDPHPGSQADAARRFLNTHRGRVDLVTVSLWSNDANAFIQGCHVDPICIGDNAPRAIGEFAGRLSSILNVLREAAPDTQVVVVGAVDVNVGAFAFSHPLIQAINAAMADVADRAGARFADPFPVFNPAGDTGAALCPLTGVCSPVRDTHPSDLGYQVLADLIADQLRPGAL